MGVFDFLKKDVIEKVKVPALAASVVINSKTYAINNMAANSFTATGAGGLGQGATFRMKVAFKDSKENIAFICDGQVAAVVGKDAKINFVNLDEARRLKVAGFLTRYLRSR
ncbi:hypothetical protein [Nitrospirillum sp. BR 11828]|uniref:hypothetical protein n=1 Tax=Nitrospirillum sp. BR 11828 TaxID=3104325 RepID=UPI002ACA3E62|nr:hypothetical protein [Nitrospirillum sp. BR 11828]MDZ5647360.1 hypothetical protein [Nitrospirillum sp. BR 11828]